MEWRLASHRLKEEPHHLWYLLKHILASKFTYLFRGIPPGHAQPLADCLTQLHREACEILAQCETIPDISFDLARIREGVGLGYADDLLDSAFAASKIASLRSIEQVNPGFLDSVKEIFAAGTTACHDLAFSCHDLACSSISWDLNSPTFFEELRQSFRNHWQTVSRSCIVKRVNYWPRVSPSQICPSTWPGSRKGAALALLTTSRTAPLRHLRLLVFGASKWPIPGT